MREVFGVLTVIVVLAVLYFVYSISTAYGRDPQVVFMALIISLLAFCGWLFAAYHGYGLEAFAVTCVVWWTQFCSVLNSPAGGMNLYFHRPEPYYSAWWFQWGIGFAISICFGLLLRKKYRYF